MIQVLKKLVKPHVPVGSRGIYYLTKKRQD